MQIFTQKKISEILEITDEFLLSFEEIIPKALAIAKSEIFSNPKFHELIGNNPQTIFEDLILSHIKILLTAIQFDNMNILKNGLSHIYRYCQSKGFSGEIFKIEFFALDNALNTLIKYNKEEIKKINQEIYEQFDKILTPIDLSEKKYAKNDKDEEFIRKFTSKLIDMDFIESEILIKSYIIDDERRERLYDQILYQSVEIIKDLFENFLIDESHTNMVLSIFNRVISSIYISNTKTLYKNIFIIYFPIEGLLGMNLYTIFHKIQSQIVADMLDYKGYNSIHLNYKELINLDLKETPDLFLFWGINPYNFYLFYDLRKLLKFKFSNIKSLLFISELDERKMKDYGYIVHDLREISEVSNNDKKIFQKN